MTIDSLIALYDLNNPLLINKQLSGGWRYQSRDIGVNLNINQVYVWYNDRFIKTPVTPDKMESLQYFPVTEKSCAITFNTPNENFYSTTLIRLKELNYEMKGQESLKNVRTNIFLNANKCIKVAKLEDHFVVLILDKKDYDRGFDIK